MIGGGAMKRIVSILCGSILFVSGQVLAGEMPEKVNKSYARSLFMSTAGSTVQYEEKKEAPKKVSKSKKNTQIAQKTTFSSGIQIQILRLADGNTLKPVNPYKYVFKEGDKFKVRVSVNLPGVIMFYNIDPAKNESYLGAWPIEKAFSTVELPYEGYFEFYGVKGLDELYIVFKPCRVTNDLVSDFEKKTSYSRSIRVVNSDMTEKVRLREDVMNNLPACISDVNYYGEEKVKNVSSQFVSYSRSIRVAYDNEGTLYSFSSADTKKRMPSQESGDFIVTKITFKFMSSY